MMAPKLTMTGGPRRGPNASTSHPSTGVSQVSVAMKMENATWMAAMPQPWAWCIGLTNRVQAYCRLAIRIMQTRPSQSCDQRSAFSIFASDTMRGASRTLLVGEILAWICDWKQRSDTCGLAENLSFVRRNMRRPAPLAGGAASHHDGGFCQQGCGDRAKSIQVRTMAWFRRLRSRSQTSPVSPGFQNRLMDCTTGLPRGACGGQ